MEKVTEEFPVKVGDEVYGPIPLERLIADFKNGELKNEATKFPISVMLNLLGDLWFRSGEQLEPKFEMIAGPGISLHLYGKAEPRIGRKMGHITVLGLKNKSQEDVMEKTETIRKILWEN